MVKTGVLLTCCFIANISIYTYEVNGANGASIDFDVFRNRKILLVNIATGSIRANQIGELQQLQELYGDSLVIVAFPSNSFGNEPRTNAEIAAFCDQNYGATFYIAEKNSVEGPQKQPIYKWLASPSQNGVLSGIVAADFHKFLIGSDGSLMGSYASMVSPMDSVLLKAILDIE